MDANVIDRLQQINLMSEEDEVITVRSERRDKTLEECFLNLLEEFLTPRPLNLRAAKNLLWFVWKMESDLKIIEVGDGLFQFKFALESQVSWVMNNGPWNFDNWILVLRRWERGMMAWSVNFTGLPIWVQVWGLPCNLINDEAGLEVGKSLGHVIEVDYKALTTNQARFLRVRVVLSLDKPIRRGGPVVNPKGDKV